MPAMAPRRSAWPRCRSRLVADHLASWVPSLAQDVEKRAATGFYRGLAALTRDFIEAEADDLAASR